MARRGITKPAEIEAAITGAEISRPTNEEIAARAYGIYVREGRAEGRDMDHWLRAEAELINERDKSRNGSRNEKPQQRAGNEKLDIGTATRRGTAPEKMAV